MNIHSNTCVARLLPGVWAGLMFVATSCGGTYTNEDIEYQTVVPARGHLLPKVAAQRVAGSAEYYQLTVTMAEVYGGVLDPVADVLERVRRHPATSRTAESRIWGPFPDENRPNFSVRVRMERAPDADSGTGVRFQYWMEIAPKGTVSKSDAWAAFISGWFDSSSGVREGRGLIVINVESLRMRGYPEGPKLDTLRTLSLSYNTTGGQRVLDARQVNQGPTEARETALFYHQAGDGSGLMRFDVIPNETGQVGRFEIVSAWQANGAGRGELLILEGAGAGLTGTDCWNTSTLPTYSQRAWELNGEPKGDPSTCVLPPLRQ